MNKITPYITEKSTTNGFDFYKYLHIKGGSGNWLSKKEKFLNGGEYEFVIFYASPEQMEGLDKCERIWCIEKGIPYGIGSTIEEAYSNYLKKVKV